MVPAAWSWEQNRRPSNCNQFDWYLGYCSGFLSGIAYRADIPNLYICSGICGVVGFGKLQPSNGIQCQHQ
jgi:hypothetical protein